MPSSNKRGTDGCREEGTTYGFYTILQHSSFGFKLSTYLVSKHPISQAMPHIQHINPKYLKSRATAQIRNAVQQAAASPDSGLFGPLRAARMAADADTQAVNSVIDPVP